MSVLYDLAWVLGYMVFPGLAYLVPHFRYLQGIVTAYEISVVFLIWKLPESPRWQLTHGKFNEAEIAITEAAEAKGQLKSNEIKRKLQLLKSHLTIEEEKLLQERKNTIIDLWKVPRLLKYCIVMYITWFVNVFVYYGLSLNAGDLGGNIFTNFLILGLAEGVSNVFIIFAMRQFGRKPLLIGFLMGAGLACLGIIPISIYELSSSYSVGLAMLGIMIN